MYIRKCSIITDIGAIYRPPDTDHSLFNKESVGKSLDESSMNETVSCIGEKESCIDEIPSFPPRDGPTVTTLQLDSAIGDILSFPL